MPEYGFCLNRIFPYKDRIVNSVLIKENTGQRKPVFWHISLSVKFDSYVNLDSTTRLLFCNICFKLINSKFAKKTRKTLVIKFSLTLSNEKS